MNPLDKLREVLGVAGGSLRKILGIGEQGTQSMSFPTTSQVSNSTPILSPEIKNIENVITNQPTSKLSPAPKISPFSGPKLEDVFGIKDNSGLANILGVEDTQIKPKIVDVSPILPEERKPVKITMWSTDINAVPIIREVLPQYSRSLTLSEMENETEARATVYDPKDKKQTSPSSTGVVGGKKLGWGDVASADRSIPKGTVIYVKELGRNFVINDRLNGAYSEVPGYNHFDFATIPGSKEEKMVKNLPKITFKIVK